jgi:hypothetical protein
VIIGNYEPPVDDRLLYYIARTIDIYGIGDLDELVQEGRIRVWQLWQEAQWRRNLAPRGQAFYSKAAQRRMQTILYKHTRTFGDTPRPGYVDALNRASSISAEGFVEPLVEMPFDLLDRVPAELMA